MSDIFNVGVDPLSYSGIAVMKPAIQGQRDPTTADIGYDPGQMWINMLTSARWINGADIGGVAAWGLVGAGVTGAIISITGGSGGAEVPDGGGNFNILGTANQITTTGTANTETISLPSAIIAPGSITTTTSMAVGTTLTSAGATTLATTGASVNTFGNTTGATSLALRVGAAAFSVDGVTNSTYSVGASTTTGTILIGGTAQTGNLTIGSSSGTNAVRIANGAGASTVSIAAVQVAGAVNIGTAMTTGTVSVGGTAGTGLISIGLATNATGQTVEINNAASNTGANIVNILNGATPGASTTLNVMNGAGTAGTQTVNILASGATRAGAVNIGTGIAAHAITLGQVTSTIAVNGPQTNTLASGAAVGLTVNTSAGTGGCVSLTSSAVTVPDLASNVGGILVTPTKVGAGASPQVANNRHFEVIFSGVSIAAAADQTLTITNSTIAGNTTSVMLSMAGATTGSALSIKSVTPSAGSLAIVVTNGTGATTTTANIKFTGWVMD